MVMSASDTLQDDSGTTALTAIRGRRVIDACPHTDEPFYSKGMCHNCYHYRGRVKPATECAHTERPNYARG